MDSTTFLKSIRLKGIQIRLASPNIIRRWAERTLPNDKIVGQVTSSQTVNYQKDKKY
jgi:DNA-directed RNA polymerase subunit beta'